MKKIHWAALAVGAALLAGLALWRMPMPRPPAPAAPQVVAPPRPEPRVEAPPPAEQVASAAESARLRRQVNTALAAAANGEAALRAATVDALKRERPAARRVIAALIAESSNPDYMRQLDLLDSELEAP
jgi:hypothetical protein